MENTYIGYEYKQLTVSKAHQSFYMDCYRAFGWEKDKNIAHSSTGKMVTLALKRNRNIINKAELTRLQRNFEACANEIDSLERSKAFTATLWSIVTGIIGTAFMAGSVFAITHKPPVIWLCVLLAVPAFIGWILPIFVYKALAKKQTQKVQPIIEAKQNEIYEICQKGHTLQ